LAFLMASIRARVKKPSTIYTKMSRLKRKNGICVKAGGHALRPWFRRGREISCNGKTEKQRIQSQMRKGGGRQIAKLSKLRFEPGCPKREGEERINYLRGEWKATSSLAMKQEARHRN